MALLILVVAQVCVVDLLLGGSWAMLPVLALPLLGSSSSSSSMAMTGTGELGLDSGDAGDDYLNKCLLELGLPPYCSKRQRALTEQEQHERNAARIASGQHAADPIVPRLAADRAGAVAVTGNGALGADFGARESSGQLAQEWCHVPVPVANWYIASGVRPSTDSLHLWSAMSSDLRSSVVRKLWRDGNNVLPSAVVWRDDDDNDDIGRRRSLSPSRCLDVIVREGDELAPFVQMGRFIQGAHSSRDVEKLVVELLSGASWGYIGVTRYLGARVDGRYDTDGATWIPGHRENTNPRWQFMHALVYSPAGIALEEHAAIGFVLRRTTLARRLVNAHRGGGHFEVWKPGLLYLLTAP